MRPTLALSAAAGYPNHFARRPWLGDVVPSTRSSIVERCDSEGPENCVVRLASHDDLIDVPRAKGVARPGVLRVGQALLVELRCSLDLDVNAPLTEASDVDADAIADVVERAQFCYSTYGVCLAVCVLIVRIGGK